MDILLHDAKFWAAIVLLVKVILFYAIPTFPEQLWAAIDALLAVVVGALAGVEARQQVLVRRAARSRQL
jgi:hypothetical protein